ncbi:GAF domain-containing sensor histidine kinase [Pelagovum pacificum]|uniref:histidine kinase n=1 Tax=Pelagovum pacificum TaxID=2588711 RepID=A0A5C5GBS4_9RHOB|nr:GAF domain-containing sensor histidine kinase [Pelagovum pacificum]QQA44698.1 GAF domain-containing sensor histidine kinase [Pelagovum pacificum]TNY32193.1 GAF domain-containing sensor histidine kinase [Pelagovum pacificum]
MLVTNGAVEPGTGAPRPMYRDDEEGLYASRLNRLRNLSINSIEIGELRRRLVRGLKIAGAQWGAIILGHEADAMLIVEGQVPAPLHRMMSGLKGQLGSCDPGPIATQSVAHGCRLATSRLDTPDGRVGTVLMGLPRRSSDTTDASALVDLIADEMAGRIDSFSQRQQIDHIRGHLSLIHKLGQRLTTTHDQAALFEEICRLLRQSLGYDHIQILLTNAPEGTVRLSHADSPHAEQMAKSSPSVRVGQGIIGRVAETGQLWNSPDVSRDPHFVANRALPATASELALPLRIGQRVIGVLDIQSEEHAAFPRQDVILLQTVADQIAPVIEQQRLFAAERAERQLSSTLAEVSRIISSQLEPRYVLDAVLRELRRVVPYCGSRVTLRSDDGRMRVVAAVGFPDNDLVLSHSFDVGETPLAKPVVENHETLRLADVREHEFWTWQPGTEQIVSWLAAPLVHGTDCIGWLCVDWPEPGFFSADHERIVRAFAEQAVVAIENARLYDAARHLSSALELKVTERTRQLEQAHQDISEKAEALRALWRRLVDIQETERKRIAHDLHDSAAQSILAATYQLQSIRRRVSDQPDLERRTTECQRTLDATLNEMKQIIYALRPTLLDEMGLVAALENHAGGLRRITNLKVDMQVIGTPRPLTADIELAIYRIIQEACQNCVRHADARKLALVVAFDSDIVTVSIEDDGRGFSEDAAQGGLGLIGMRERSHAIGAELVLSAIPGTGTRLELRLPRQQAA